MSPYQPRRHTGVEVWLVPLILISAPDGGEQSASHSGHFTTGEEAPVPIQREAGWALLPVWTIWKKNLFPLPKSKVWIIQTHCLVTILTELLQGPWYTWASWIQILLSHLCVCQQVDLEWRFHCKTLLTDRALVRCNIKTHITETHVLYFTNCTMYQDFRMGGPRYFIPIWNIFGPQERCKRISYSMSQEKGVPCGPKKCKWWHRRKSVCCAQFELTLWWIQCFHDWSSNPWI